MECRKCGEDKPTDAFEFRKDSNKHRTECRECRHKWAAAARYGLSLEEYHELFDRFEHRCAICKVDVEAAGHATFKRLVVDHDHRTGEVRGILCAKCNTGLGQFDDSIAKLKQAILYLQNF